MPIVISGLKIGLSQIAKYLVKEAPGTAYIALNGAVIAGEIAAGESLGSQSQIYIPVYGPTGIDAGVVSYTAVNTKRLNISKQACYLKALPFMLLLAVLTFGIQSTWAKGLKGNLEKEELDFIYNTFNPILIKHHICTNAHGDCNDDYVICTSLETLTCDVYSLSDEKVIKELFLAAMSSELNISRFTFWQSKYHQKSFFEKPILQFTNRTGRE